MSIRFLLLLFFCVLPVAVQADTCVDCTARCCAQSALGEVCEPSCQKECDAQRQLCIASQSASPKAYSAAPLFNSASAHSGAILLPGRQAMADGALMDIRAIALQMRQDATALGNTGAEVIRAQTVIDSYITDAGRSTLDAAARAREQQLVQSLWLSGTRDDTRDQLAAERIARGATFANATAQLADSVYGGPPGAAAYAAWWAFRQPDTSAQQALRVGLLAGGGLWDTAVAADGHRGSVDEVQRTTLAAALGGLVIAAAGGDEQALRALFFDRGAALLLRDGEQIYCLSARVQCQKPLVSALIIQGGQAVGWAIEHLQPATSPVGTAFAPMAQADSAAVPPLPRAQGAMALEDGWIISWQIAKGVENGVLYPGLVMSRSKGAKPLALPPATVADVSVALPAPAAGPAPVAAKEPVWVPAPAPQTAAAPANAGAPAEAPSAAVPARTLCERGADRRVIWVLPANQNAGYVCRAMYQVGNTQTILWNAQQNPAACQAKAQARIEHEQAKGYTCREAAE